MIRAAHHVSISIRLQKSNLSRHHFEGSSIASGICKEDTFVRSGALRNPTDLITHGLHEGRVELPLEARLRELRPFLLSTGSHPCARGRSSDSVATIFSSQCLNAVQWVRATRVAHFVDLQSGVCPRQGVDPHLTHVQRVKCPLNPHHASVANVSAHR